MIFTSGVNDSTIVPFIEIRRLLASVVTSGELFFILPNVPDGTTSSCMELGPDPISPTARDLVPWFSFGVDVGVHLVLTLGA